MCLIVFAFKQHPHYPLIITANRDEYYQRPTAHAHHWHDHPHIYAGRDLQAQGTWLGINQQGGFAALTNIREASRAENGKSQAKPPRSRGELCWQYLDQQQLPAQSTSEIVNQFAGFNLIAGNIEELHYISNRQNSVQQLQAGIYGLSNGLLDSPWPKVISSKKQLAHCIQTNAVNHEQLIAIMQNTAQAADEKLPDTGIGLEWERQLSSRFIHTEHYGTRCSSSLLFNQHGEISFVEQSYDHLGQPNHRSELQLQASP